MDVKIVNKSKHNLPQYATDGSSGMDLKADLDSPIVLSPMERCVISTGLMISLPHGYEAQVRPRSGLAAKKGLTVLNAPGTIDEDFRGVIGVILINLSNEKVIIEPGERIAQIVFAKYEKCTWNEVNTLDETERGVGGFGSTGKH